MIEKTIKVVKNQLNIEIIIKNILLDHLFQIKTPFNFEVEGGF